MMTMGWLSIGRVVVTIFSLPIVSVIGKNEGVAIFADGSDRLPRYALWDGDTFSASHAMNNVGGGPWIAIRGAYSPVRDEAIVVGVTNYEVVTGHIYSQGQWRDLPFSIGGDPPPIIRPKSKTYKVDVRYESQSGYALIVWFEDASARYAKWTGSNWSFGTISTPAGGDSDRRALKLEASPKSNEMVLLVNNASWETAGGEDFAIVWNGDSWGDGVALGHTGYLTGPDVFDVAYEQQSGRAIVIYFDGSTSVKYLIWNGVTWSTEGFIPRPKGVPQDQRTWFEAISADPSTNRIVAALRSHGKEGSNYWMTVWDRNNWGSETQIDLESTSMVRIAVAFEGTSQRALAVYAGDGEKGSRYRTWSSSLGWSKETRGPNIDNEALYLTLYTDNKSNDVMLAIRHGIFTLSDLYWESSFCKWGGDGWGEVNFMSRNHDIETDEFPIFFMWKPELEDTRAPTAFPTPHPTSPPTHFPTPPPSMKPTDQPTVMPTPHPTRAPVSPSPTGSPTSLPTDQPTVMPTPHPTRAPVSPSPTGSPTSLPTPVKTQSPTPAPSMKPTNVPTPVPTSATPAVSDQSPSVGENDIGPAIETLAPGRPCENKSECQSNTCRNGVCMATSACFPLRHKFGEPFFEHKINIVFVASGFDTASKEEWHAHVNRTYKSFENYTMFSDEVEQLNMFRVDPWELDSSFCAPDCAGIARLLCCSQYRALSLAQKCFPVGSNLQTVVIHNDDRYGGGGYVIDNIATVTTHPMASVVAVHELGHSLFDLADEYSYGSGTDAEPNCDSNSSCYKWSDLIGNTPPGYEPVRCLPGCRNNNFYVGAKSFMGDLNSPMGAVNDRFTCCTYCALTKSFPTYCKVFDKSPNYLLNYCKNNDYQQYGSASYDREPLLYISDGSIRDESTKYVQVEYPVLVSITTKHTRSDKAVYRSKPYPLEAGMFLRSRVEGDFSSPRMALKQGEDSVFRVVTIYRTNKQVLYFSRNATIEVPISLDPADHNDEPLAVSELVESFNFVADTKGKQLQRIKVRVLDLSTTTAT